MRRIPMLLLAAVSTLGAFADVTACEVEAACCSATKSCAPNSTCFCWFICGEITSVCSCSCLQPGDRPQEIFNPAPGRVGLSTAGVGLEPQQSGLDAGNVGRWIQDNLGWGVSIPSSHFSDAVVGGAFSGTLQEALEDFDTANSAFTLSFDSTNGVITFNF